MIASRGGCGSFPGGLWGYESSGWMNFESRRGRNGCIVLERGVEAICNRAMEDWM